MPTSPSRFVIVCHPGLFFCIAILWSTFPRKLNTPGAVHLKKAAKALESAEIALIDCHDYDVLRKKLLSLGLVSLDLSSMGLEAIEKEAFDLQKLVRIHEIRY